MLFLRLLHRCVFVFGIAAIAVFSSQAFASDITVGSPSSARLTSPIWIRAHNVGCEGVPPSAFGYSIDDSRVFVRGKSAYDVDVSRVFLSGGMHTVHFKAWTARGICPVFSRQFIVAGPYPSSSAAVSHPSPTLASESLVSEYGGISNAGVSQPVPAPPHTPPVTVTGYLPGAAPPLGDYGIPPNAVSFGNLDGNSDWAQIHDGGTPGTSRGSSSYPATTPLYDEAREFFMSYTNHAGERWSIIAGNDPAATHFVMDAYVFFPNPSEVLNLELDINQVTPNGETVIFGTQCSGITGTWESTYTSGKYDHWWSSSIKCDPRTWTANVWHHVQIAVHRDSSGVVTHDWLNLDGVYYRWGYTRPSGRHLGWQPGSINVQYQIEGSNKSSGSVTSYVHELTVYRW